MSVEDVRLLRSQLYLDLDGILADFDTLAGHHLGTNNIYKWEFIHGGKAFWEILDAVPDFFLSLPMCHRADILWERVSHLSPVILTALPKVGAYSVERQKRAWVRKNLGPDVEVICCQTREKPDYCAPGDVLVDDRAINRDRWQEKGGSFVLHEGVYSTLARLSELNIL